MNTRFGYVMKISKSKNKDNIGFTFVELVYSYCSLAALASFQYQIF